MLIAAARTSVIGASVVAMALVAAISTSMAASVSTTMFLAALAVAPGLVIALLMESASPPVAEILHASEARGRRP